MSTENDPIHKRIKFETIPKCIKSFMEENNSNAHIIFDVDEISPVFPHANFVRKISNFSGSSANLLFTFINNELNLYAYTDGRYFLQAENELKDFELKKIGIDTSIFLFLKNELKKEKSEFKKVTVDFKKVSNSIFEQFEKNLKSEHLESEIKIEHLSNESLLKFIPENLLFVKDENLIESCKLIDLEKIKLKDVIFIDKNQNLMAYCKEILSKVLNVSEIFSQIQNYSEKNDFIKKITEIYDSKKIEKFEDYFNFPVTFLTFDEKKEILQSYLKNGEKILITDLSDITWLLNIRTNKYNSGCFLSWCIIEKEKVILFTDSDIERKNIEIRKYKKFWKFLDAEVQNNENNTIYVSKNCNRFITEKIKSRKKNNSLIQDLKSIKNNIELIGMLQANIIDGIALTKLFFYLKNNFKNEDFKIFEEEVDEKLLEFKKKVTKMILETEDYFIQPSFNSIIGSGKNAALIHYRTQKIPVNRDVLLLDTGSQFVFGTTDISRTIHLGELKSDKFTEHFTLVLKGVLASVNLIADQNTFKQLFHNIARIPLFKKYVQYRHGTSHGVGHCNDVHEEMTSCNETKIRNIFSLEPGAYFDNEFGIRIENCVVSVLSSPNHKDFISVSDLTFVPIQRDAIIPEMLNQEEKLILNLYNSRIQEFIGQYLTDSEQEWLNEQTKAFE